METKSLMPKLSLKKEVITKLSNDQMKKVVGGLNDVDPLPDSCTSQSCASRKDLGTCDNNSCNCTSGAN